MSSDILMSKDLSDVICKQIGIDNTLVRRIVVDMLPGQPVTIYIEKFTTKALLDVDFSRGSIKVITSQEKEQ